MNTSTHVRNFTWTLAGFVALSLLPCLMNAFPGVFAHAFSEHTGRWLDTPFLTLPIMAAVLIGWSWMAVRSAAAWQSWQRARGRAMLEGMDLTVSFSPRLRAVGRMTLILHGPIQVALFYLMWVSARISLGRWPHYGGADDPKGIFGAVIVYGAICIWFWVGIVALAAPLVRAGATRDDRDSVRATREFAVTLALIVAAVWYLSSDPHHLYTWFMD